MLPTLWAACLISGVVPPAGEWRLDANTTKVQVLAWGLFCGQVPQDARGIPGARYNLTLDGEDFSLKGAGKSFGTLGCSMDPAGFAPRLTDHKDGEYRVECQAAALAGDPQVTEHHFTVVDSAINYVTRGEKRKTENLEACRFSYETQMRFVLSTRDGPCAAPGPLHRVVVDPAALDALPGQRVCFRLAGLDAQDCAVPVTGEEFALEPRDVAVLDANHCLWAPRELKEALVVAVTVTAGDARGGAVVRVKPAGTPAAESLEQTVARAGGEAARRLISQVTAGTFVIKTPQEDEEDPTQDAAARAEVTPEALPTPAAWVPLGLAALSLLLILAGAGMFLRGRGNKTAKPASVLHLTTAPAVAPPAPGRGWICPQCRFEYASTGLCAHDGQPLVANAAAGRSTMFIPEVGGMMCPTCGQRYPSRARFCGNDRSPLVPVQSQAPQITRT